MKRYIVLFLVLFCAAMVQAEPAELYCKSVFNGTILASGTSTTETLETQRKSGYEGFFSVQPVFTGGGVLKIEYQVSNDNVNWSPVVQIVAAATTNVVYPYPAAGVNIFSGFQRLILTETGTANPVVITKVNRCAQ